MFVIKINGKPTAITNTFHSAVLYLDALQSPPSAATIAALDWDEFGLELAALEQEDQRSHSPNSDIRNLELVP